MNDRKIKKFEIRKLFNKYDVEFDLNKECNVFIGANGTGKTTILRILDYFFHGDFVNLSFIPFDELIIYTEIGGVNVNIKMSEKWNIKM